MKKVFLLIALFCAANVMAEMVTISRTVTDLAAEHGWEQGSGNNSYLKFALDENITMYSSAGNAKYLKNETEECMRYYQYGKGELTIRAKAGVIIQSVQFDYYSKGVITNNYGTDGTNTPEANQVKNGVPFKVDGNKVTLYIGSTDKTTNAQVRITKYSVTYFVPEDGFAITKSAKDLGYGLGLISGLKDGYQDIQVNNVISLHAEKTGTLKYYSDQNGTTINCYRWTGPIEIKAREGATIQSVKITYNGGPRAVLTKNWGTDGKAIPAADRIASDSILYVNSDSLKLWVGDTTLLGTKSSTSPTLGITKIYVNYTDSNAIIEDFRNCTVEKSDDPVTVIGVDSIYSWQLTGFSREMSHHLYYDQTTQIYKGQKISANNDEGGMKEVSFEWYASNKDQNAKFAVKAGADPLAVVDSAATGGWYPVTFTKTGIKKNGAFAIEVDATSGSQVEINHVSIIPYLLYKTKSITIAAKDFASTDFKYTNDTALIDNTDGEGTIAYAVSGDNADKIASIDAATGEITIKGEGTVNVTASWEDVTATYPLTIVLETPTIGFAESEVTKKVSAQSYKQTLSFTTPSSGTVTYSLISGPASGTIDADGTVHFTEAGDYVIQGKFDALPYKADSATYTLTVTDLLVPELSFAESSIEKLMGAADFTNALTTTAGIGDTTYTSSADTVAEVSENGLVHIKGAGTTTIKATTAQTATYAAGSASYTLKVFALSNITFAGDTSVYRNAPAFIRKVTTIAGDGAITYDSGDKEVATVDNNGEVTIVGDGTTTITAIIAKTETYWADTASYNLTVSTLSMPTASFTEAVVNKTQNDAPFTNTLVTESDGVKHYSSSDTRVATVNDSTGEVTIGEKPGKTIITVNIDQSDTWEAISTSYTVNVSALPVAGWNFISKTIAQIKGQQEWPTSTDVERGRYNVPIDSVITLSYGKYYTDAGGQFRYYYGNNYAGRFTIQAKAGVIIQTVKFTYTGDENTVLANAYYSGNVAADNQFTSGTTYVVDANAITCHVGITGSNDNHRINVTSYEIKYFDPATGVAVTKTGGDLGKDVGLEPDSCYQDIAINHAITLHADANNTLRYKISGQFNCYRWCGPIDIIARPGATIHYVKITYSGGPEATLTKYFGADGKNIPESDRIASDSVIYVQANSLRLWIGDTDGSGATLGIKKIYVNYTDSSVVTVENFDNCESTGTSESVDVAGVDGKYDWSIYNFSRSDADRMYYDQSVKLNKGGKIVTEYTGGLKEVAFDWHPSSNDSVNFTVTVGDSTYTISKATQDNVYAFNFQKTAIESNGEFSIKVNSDAAVEIGHISLTPYLIYTDKAVTIAAKDYKIADYKYTNQSLINYTDQDATYSIVGDASIAEVNASTGEVTIKGGGTVTVKAAVGQIYTTYELSIALEEAELVFTKADTSVSVLEGSFKQEATKVSTADVVYSVAGQAGVTSIDQDGTVHFTEAGVLTITAVVAQQLPYKADTATYTLTIQRAEPEIGFAEDTIVKSVVDEPFVILPVTSVGAGDTTFTSTNEQVATVNTLTGEVTIIGEGETTIKASIAQNGIYEAKEASYLLIVEGQATELKNASSANNDVHTKIVVNGQLRIIRGGKQYNAQGARL